MPTASKKTKSKINPRLVVALVLVFGFILSVAFVSSAAPIHNQLSNSINPNVNK